MTKITIEEYLTELSKLIRDKLFAPVLNVELNQTKDKMNFESDVEVEFRKMLDEHGIDYSEIPVTRPRVR